jgi:hypothetical protein
MTEFEVKLVVAAAVGGILLMIGIFIHFRRKVAVFTKELEDAVADSGDYEAIVQSVDESGNPVLLFRDENNKATIVHKYKSSGMKKYTVGEHERIRYSDEREFSLIPDDNPYFKKMFRFARISVCAVMAIPLAILIFVLIILLR